MLTDENEQTLAVLCEFLRRPFLLQVLNTASHARPYFNCNVLHSIVDSVTISSRAIDTARQSQKKTDLVVCMISSSSLLIDS